MSSEKMHVCFTQKDQEDFHEGEKEIAAHQASFLRVAEILIEFRDRKLYLIAADTFEEYVQNRWGWSRQRGYQLIAAREVVKSLPEKCQHAVDTEASARALSKVPPKRRARVIHDVQQNGAVTAPAIREAAERIAPPPKHTPPAAPAKPPAPDIVYDKTGYAVPDTLLKLFERGEEVLNELKKISALRGMLRRVDENKDELWAPVNKSMIIADLDRVYYELKMALPFVVCPYCQGRDDTKTHCTTCKGRGALAEHIWKTAIPEELKSVREKSCKK